MPLLFVGWQEVLVIVGLGVLFFGATKLPQLGSGMGKGIRNFKSALAGKDEPEELEKGDQKESKS